jgi:hypothetical protein
MTRLVEHIAAALRAAEQDAARLDWLLMDYQPDSIGGIDIWEQLLGDDCTEDEMWDRYLTGCRAAIDAARTPDD